MDTFLNGVQIGRKKEKKARGEPIFQREMGTRWWSWENSCGGEAMQKLPLHKSLLQRAAVERGALRVVQFYNFRCVIGYKVNGRCV